jgi:hypothetical protein
VPSGPAVSVGMNEDGFPGKAGDLVEAEYDVCTLGAGDSATWLLLAEDGFPGSLGLLPSGQAQYVLDIIRVTYCRAIC